MVIIGLRNARAPVTTTPGFAFRQGIEKKTFGPRLTWGVSFKRRFAFALLTMKMRECREIHLAFMYVCQLDSSYSQTIGSSGRTSDGLGENKAVG